MKPSGFLQTVFMMLSMMLGGCSQYFYDMGDPLNEADLLRLDERTTLTDALVSFGPPQRMSATEGGYVMAWEHWQVRETKLGFSLGFAGAEAFSIDWGDANVQGEFILLAFNSGHQLVNAAFSDWDNNAGGGKSLQPFGGLVAVVDIDDLLDRMPQHRWGASSLARLPVALNRDNRPDTGQNGLEQRGTPTGLGQRSLEMD